MSDEAQHTARDTAQHTVPSTARNEDEARSAPAPRRRSLFYGGIAFVLLLLAGLTASVVPRLIAADRERADASRKAAAAAAVTADLQLLAAQLGSSPAVRYTGTFLAAGRNETINLDARITAEGTLLGTLRTVGTYAEILEIGDRTFIRGDQDFWFQDGVVDGRQMEFLDRWVLVGDAVLGLDLTGTFGPAALAAGVSAPVPGTLATAEGIVVRRIAAGDRTFQLSTDEPKRLVRVVADSPSGHRYELKPAVLGGAERTAFFADLRKAAGELRTAAAIASRIAVKSKSTTSCDHRGCTARLTFINKILPTAKYASEGVAPSVLVLIVMFRNGKPVKSCTVVIDVAPGAQKDVTCVATAQARDDAPWKIRFVGGDWVLTPAQSKAIVTALNTELGRYGKPV